VIAVAYSWLLDTPRRFAKESAERKTLSGIDMAVFIPEV